MSRIILRRLSAMAATVFVVLAGCSFSEGPAYFRIETGGVRYDDFVIEPIQEYGRIHSSDMVVMDPLIVASEEDLFVMKAAFMPQQWTLELPVMHEVDIFHIDDLSARRRRRWMHHKTWNSADSVQEIRIRHRQVFVVCRYVKGRRDQPAHSWDPAASSLPCRNKARRPLIFMGSKRRDE